MPFEIFAGENVTIKFALLSMADGLTFLGQWLIGTAYITDNVVTDLEVAYKSILPGTGHQPPNATYWEVLPAVGAADVKSATVELVQDGVSVVDWEYEAIGLELTGGLLVYGQQYLIDTYAGSDNFTNVGAASNASGVIFTATNTTPAVWTNFSALRKISKPANLILTDGVLTLELLPEDTLKLSGDYELRLTLSTFDNTYIESGAQTDVLCLDDVLTVTPC